MLNAILNLVFPVDCVVCGNRVLEWRCGALCDDCERGLQPADPPFCVRCGTPHRTPETRCHRCLEGATGFDLARFALVFDDPLRTAIHHFKYNDRVSLARPLGRCMGRCLARNPFTAETAVPVPLHGKRERRRGYNQAGLLAEQLGLEVRADLIRRVRPTDTQTGLSRPQRARNVRNAFACPARVSGTLLVVDDVMTTGATINEVARVLKKNGASRVEVLTLTRVGVPDQGETGALRETRVSMTQ